MTLRITIPLNWPADWVWRLEERAKDCGMNPSDYLLHLNVDFMSASDQERERWDAVKKAWLRERV